MERWSHKSTIYLVSRRNYKKLQRLIQVGEIFLAQFAKFPFKHFVWGGYPITLKGFWKKRYFLNNGIPLGDLKGDKDFDKLLDR